MQTQTQTQNPQTHDQTHPQPEAEAEAPAQAQAQAQAQPGRPPSSCGVPPRVGKIARLPEPIREQLNLRLEEGEGGEPLLAWLNGLPETRQLLEQDFGGRPINKQNLSDWRQGGLAEWQLRRQLAEQARSTRSQAQEMRQDGAGFLIDDLLLVFTARYAALLSRWNGEVTPEFEAQVKVFSRLRRDLLSLQKSAHWSARQLEEWERIEAERARRKKEELKRQARAPLDAYERRVQLRIKHGLRGEELADRLNTIDYGEPDPRFFTHEQWQELTGGQSDEGVEEWDEEEEELDEAQAWEESQGGEETAEAAQTEPIKPEPSGEESSQVKPVSPAPSQGGAAGENADGKSGKGV